MTNRLLIIFTIVLATFVIAPFPSSGQVGSRQFAPEKVTSTPSSKEMSPGEAATFTIEASSSELPPFLTIEVDEGLIVEGQPICSVNVFAYPLGSGPERSRTLELDCTGGWWTDTVSGTTHMEAGVPNPNMNPVSHKIVVELILRVSTNANPGQDLHIRANERLNTKSIAEIRIGGISPTKTTSVTPNPIVKEIDPEDTSALNPFIPKNKLSGKPGGLVRVDLEPVLVEGMSVVHLELILPSGTEIDVDTSCVSSSSYSCRAPSISKLNDGSVALKWRLSIPYLEKLDISVTFMLPDTATPGEEVTIRANVGYAASGSSPSEMYGFDLPIAVTG